MPTLQTYQVTIRGVRDGFSRDRVVDALTELFKRPREQAESILEREATVKRGVDLPTAEKYRQALEQRGCLCVVTPETEDKPVPVGLSLVERPDALAPEVPSQAAAPSHTISPPSTQDMPQQPQADKRTSPESQFATGEKYEYGRGVPQDFAKAAVWYRRAAEQGHAAAQEKLHRVWLDGELTPMKSTPSLFTLNSMGFRLYGRSEHDPDSESFMTTHYLVILFLPILPIARYRVVSPSSGVFSFLGKGKLRTIDKLHIALAMGLFLAFCLAARRH